MPLQPRIFFAVCWVGLLCAQSDRGVITGTVRDSSDAAVPAAAVTATNIATNIASSTVSTESGDFTIPSLAAGQYRVRIEKSGFRAFQQDNVTVTASGVFRVAAVLQVGATQEVVNVVADVISLQTETAKVQSQVANKLVEQLPLVVGGGIRSPFDLAIITPETKASRDTDTGFVVGGGQASSWGMTLDGVTVTTGRALQTTWAAWNSPSLDAITEFTVDSGGFKAEHAHAAGGVMTFVSKSGTNDFHGNVYEFIRNNAFDARLFFERQKRVYKQHDFGFTAGGPVYIPKLYNGRNKTFFLWAFEGFRNRVGVDATPLSAPPEEFHRGDFRTWVDQNNAIIPIYDPATTRQQDGRFVRTPFAANQIPTARIDPLSVQMLNVARVLKPNRPGIVPGTLGYVQNNFIQSGTSIQPWNKYSLKGDHVFTEKHRIAGSWTANHRKVTNGPSGHPGLTFPLTNFRASTQDSNVFRFSWDYTISPKWLNRFYAGGNQMTEDHNNATVTKVSGINWKDQVCLKNVPDCGNNLLQVVFNGEFTDWSGASNGGSENTTYSFNDDMTYVSGKHTFKWGYIYERTHYNGYGFQEIMGRVNVDRLSTSVPQDTNRVTGGGSAFASFLLGQAFSGGIHTVRYIGQQWRYHGMYFQDDWRVNPRFTLNYGLRYEITLPPLEHKDQWSDFDPTRPNPAADNRPGALRFAGFGEGREGRRALVPGWYGAVGPRLGFAYSLDKKTVVRASAGRTFGAVRTVTGSTHFLGFIQITNFINTSQGLEPTFLLRDGMPAYPLPPFLDPSFANNNSPAWWQGRQVSRAPEQLNFNFNIQRQLTNDLLVEAGYSAVNGTHLQAGLLNYNQLDYRNLPANLSPFTGDGRTLLNSNINSPAAQGAGIARPYRAFAGSVAQALRPFPQFAFIDTWSGAGDRSGHSTYHALILKLEKRSASGLTFLTSYVRSKLLTDADNYFPGAQAMDHYNRRLEKSIGQYDQTHNFKLSYVYELPFGKGRRWSASGPADLVLGGWRVGAIHLYATSNPVGLDTTIRFPIFHGRNSITTPTNDGWRGPVRGGKFDPNVDSFLQPVSFFGTQPTDRFGNTTRFNDKLRYWPNLTENLSVGKTFSFTEKLRMDFRWEAFNLFNRTWFGPLGGATTLQNQNFGLWRRQENDSRRMQFGLKLYW
jgi:hypothetical protein